MSGSPAGSTLYLSDALAARVLAAASRAYPNECCGLIEGVSVPDGWRALAIHEAANIAEHPARRFLIDPKAQFDLMRRLRGSESALIGCFHSHPDGCPEPSATDRDEAYESGFLYLIAAGRPDMFTLSAFLFTDAAGFAPLAMSAAE